MTALPGSGWRPAWWNSRLPTPDEARAIRALDLEPTCALAVRIGPAGLALWTMPAARAAWERSPEAARLDEAAWLRVAAAWNRAEPALIRWAEEDAAGIADGPGAAAAAQALDRLEAEAAPWRLPDSPRILPALIAQALAILPDAFAPSRKGRRLGEGGMAQVREAAEAARAAVLNASEAAEGQEDASPSAAAAERLAGILAALPEAVDNWRPRLPLLPAGLPRLPHPIACDPRRREIAELFAAIWEGHGSEWWRVADLKQAARDVADPNGRGRQYLANRIRALEGTEAAGFVLMRHACDGKHAADRYRLQALARVN